MSYVGMKKPEPPPKPQQTEDEDDWETDPDFMNNVDEKQSRWGAKTIEGSGHQGSISLDKLREDVLKSDQLIKEKTQIAKSSEGYGGKFGIQKDRIDKCAAGFEYKEKVDLHPSQRDYSKGFGGEFGIQMDRVDKSAVGWDSREQLHKHESQIDYKKGFGGKFGVQSDRKDKSAAGWEEREQVAKHASQTDYKKGFGGKFGVQSDRKDKLAASWKEHEQVEKHASQTDYKKGFGGQFGVQNERMDKSAVGWNDEQSKDRKQMQPIEGLNKGGASSLRKKFEQMAIQGDQQNIERAREERERRKLEDEDLRKKRAEEEEERQKRLEKQLQQVDVDEQTKGIQENPQQQLKIRQSIGVRLPFAVATAPAQTPEVEERQSMPTSQTPQIEQQMQEERPLPVQVLPTVSGGHLFGASAAAHALLMHKRKSTEVNDEWEQEELNQNTLQKHTMTENTPETESITQNEDLKQTENIECHMPTQSYHQYKAVPEELNVQQAPNNVLSGDATIDEPNPPADPVPQTNSLSGGQLCALALYEYERQDDDEISFDVNDLITDIEQIDAGWWRGCCNGQHGLFPANYVQLIEQ